MRARRVGPSLAAERESPHAPWRTWPRAAHTHMRRTPRLPEPTAREGTGPSDHATPSTTNRTTRKRGGGNAREAARAQSAQRRRPVVGTPHIITRHPPSPLPRMRRPTPHAPRRRRQCDAHADPRSPANPPVRVYGLRWRRGGGRRLAAVAPMRLWPLRVRGATALVCPRVCTHGVRTRGVRTESVLEESRLLEGSCRPGPAPRQGCPWWCTRS